MFPAKVGGIGLNGCSKRFLTTSLLSRVPADFAAFFNSAARDHLYVRQGIGEQLNVSRTKRREPQWFKEP